MPNDSNNKVNITLNSPTTNQINEFMVFFSFVSSFSIASFDGKRCDAEKVVPKHHFIAIDETMRGGISFQMLRRVSNFPLFFSPVLFAPDDFIVSFHMPQRRQCDAYVLGGVLAFANKLSFSRPPFHVIFLTALCWQHFFFLCSTGGFRIILNILKRL